MEQKKSYDVAQKSYIGTGKVKSLSLVYNWCKDQTQRGYLMTCSFLFV